MGALANFGPIPLREQPPHFALTNESAPFGRFLYLKIRANERQKSHSKCAKLSALTKFPQLRTIQLIIKGRLQQNIEVAIFAKFMVRDISLKMNILLESPK